MSSRPGVRSTRATTTLETEAPTPGAPERVARGSASSNPRSTRRDDGQVRRASSGSRRRGTERGEDGVMLPGKRGARKWTRGSLTAASACAIDSPAPCCSRHPREFAGRSSRRRDRARDDAEQALLGRLTTGARRRSGTAARLHHRLHHIAARVAARTDRPVASYGPWRSTPGCLATRHPACAAIARSRSVGDADHALIASSTITTQPQSFSHMICAASPMLLIGRAGTHIAGHDVSRPSRRCSLSRRGRVPGRALRGRCREALA